MRTFAADLIADDTFNVAAIIATVLFVIAAIMAIVERAFVIALIAVGLALFAFAWVVIS